MMIRAYLDWKAERSRKRLEAYRDKLATLPTFANHSELATYMDANFKYVPDPFWGMDDFYTHPERTQHEINTHAHAYPCDCDDYAVYAYAALARIPGYEPKIITLADLGIKWSHVICLFKHGPETGTIDTNGYRGLGLHDERALLKIWKDLYPQVWYVSAVATAYPF